MEINNKMELDAGASVSVISKTLYREPLQTTTCLKSTSIVLKTYRDQVVPVIGEIDVTVKYGKQQEILPSLFRRNWLNKIKLAKYYIYKSVRD